MKKYKVLTLYLGGLGNRVFNSGDTVTEGNFPPGHADQLVQQQFLEPLSSDDSSSESNTDDNTSSTGEGAGNDVGLDGKADSASEGSLEPVATSDKVGEENSAKDDSIKQSSKKQASAKK